MTMSQRPDKSEFSEALNYKWIDPEPSKKPAADPRWQQPENDAYNDFRDNLIADEWPVAFLRTSIESLGQTPQGRTRVALTTQYIEAFANPQRIQQALQSLQDNERQYYPYFLLHYLQVNNHTKPSSMDQMFPNHVPGKPYIEQILKHNLAMQNQYEEYFYPRALLRVLPQLEVQFKAAQTPETYVPAHAPHLLSVQLQQLLRLIQEHPVDLRPQLRWNSRSVYSSWHQEWEWPIVPEAAQMLEDMPDYDGVLNLQSPEPVLAQSALTSLSKQLDIPEHIVEFLYQCLLQAGVLYRGSPAQTNDSLIAKWITLPAGRQAALMFQSYASLSQWAAWWHPWAEGDIVVGWDYDRYQYGSVASNSLRITNTLLRRVLLDLLAMLPHDTWIDFKTFIRWVNKIYSTQKTHYYQESLVFKGNRNSWQSFLERVALAMLTGPLHWLGFVDLAPNTDWPVAFRLHHLQDIHWRRVDAVPSPVNVAFDRNSLTFAGSRLTLSLPAPSDVLAFIQTWALTTSYSNADMQFELSVPLLHGCFEMGDTVDSLMAKWQARVGFPAPPDLQSWWQYWGERYGHIRLYTHQSALFTRDAITLKEIQTAIPMIQPSIRGLIAPNFVLLDDDQVDDIISNLKRQGYMPKED